MLPHSVYMEQTPNPATMKFVSNRYLVPDLNFSFEYIKAEDTADSPLAAKLFQFPFVAGVFIAGNFVTVTKIEGIDWVDIQLELRDFITEFLNGGGEAILADSLPKVNEEDSTPSNEPEREYNELEMKIIDILDEYVRPAVANDGGAIEFSSFKDGTVEVVLKGSCSGCPSSTVTLKNGIETMLTRMVPEVERVEALNG